MSRLAKKPITIPEKVTVAHDGSTLTVTGPLGALSRAVRPVIGVSVENGAIQLSLKGSGKEARALLGTYAAHLKNMIAGVQTPFQKKLIIEGIGYKAEVKGTKIQLALGFSHPVFVDIPEGLKVTAEKGVITVSGISKELVGGFAASLKALKRPEPYKGKGIRYEGEVIKRKQGKKTA